MEDDGKVFYRFGRNSICFILPYDTFLNDILPRHQDLRKKFLRYKAKIMDSMKTFPLDYIMNLPRHLRKLEMDIGKQADAWRLENILKNVVIRRLTEIRAQKEKPSLRDMIAEYLQKKAEKDERARVRIKEQVL